MKADQGLAEDFVFGRFRLDAQGRALLCDGRRVALRSRSFELLCVLIAARGKLVTKDELMARVWPGAIVEDNALQVHVSALRKALGEDVGSQHHIVTVQGQGYRFIGEPAGRQTASITPPEVPPLPEKPSIAVMPFQNMSGDPAQDYFADGIVEDIITALTRVPSLSVVARNSSFAYKGRSVDIRQVGLELGVRYVLEGSVRKADTRLRISGQLIQADNGMHLWAEHFDGSLADIFALQDELTASVVGAVVPSLQGAEIARVRRKPPESLDAYDLYLRALACRNTMTSAGTDEALRLLEQALTLDPTFVSAAMLAAIMWALRVSQGWWSVEQAQAEALRYARLAVQIDPHDAEALAILARWIAMCERDYEEARSLAERSIAADPNSARVWRSSGYIFVYMGESQLALDHLHRGLQFNPRDSWAHESWTGIAQALMQLHRDGEAVAAARKAVQLNSLFTGSLRALAAALALIGNLDESRSVMRRHRELDPDCSLTAMKARFGFTEQASVRYFEGLRRAGMPD
jgi:TolB-like protein/Flp pilus assembly protein TadD